MGLKSYLFDKSGLAIRHRARIEKLQRKLNDCKMELDATRAVENATTRPGKAKLKARSWAGFSGSHFEPIAENRLYGQIMMDTRLSKIFEKGIRIPKSTDWALGGISEIDAEFLYGFITAFEPQEIIEVGVASGYSTSVILAAMSTYLEKTSKAGDKWLHSYDTSPTCYFDHSRATGSAVDELVPQLSGYLDLHLGENAMDCRKLENPGGVDMAFIDASHLHPWPVFDAMAVAPVLKPGAWLILHDVFLPFLNSEFQCMGPNILFSLWPGNKLLQVPKTPVRNVGAIQLFEDMRKNREILSSMMELPWECSGPAADLIKKNFSE